MKLIATTTLLLVSITASFGQKTISDLKPGDKALITRGSHDSWLIINDENEVAFLSGHSGTINLYSVDLDDMSFVKSNQKGLLMAKYASRRSCEKKYRKLTSFSDGAMDSPEYSPNGDYIAFRRYVEDTSSANKSLYKTNWNFSLMLVHTETKSLDTLLTEEVSAMTFLTDSTILFQLIEDDSNWLKIINIRSKEVTNLFRVSSEIGGITSDDNYFLVHEKLKASLYDKNTLKLLQTIEIPHSMRRVTYLGNRLTLTPRGKPSSFMKVSNGKTKPIVGSYDYQPSVSRNKKFVIVVSENFGGGILYVLE